MLSPRKRPLESTSDFQDKFMKRSPLCVEAVDFFENYVIKFKGVIFPQEGTEKMGKKEDGPRKLLKAQGRIRTFRVVYINS